MKIFACLKISCPGTNVLLYNHSNNLLAEASPKPILALMQVPGLTRENVHSHLQRYRKEMKGKGIPFTLQDKRATCNGNNHTNVDTAVDTIGAQSNQHGIDCVVKERNDELSAEQQSEEDNDFLPVLDIDF